jgi:diguanylate cyclase (GGDEF)-like protein
MVIDVDGLKGVNDRLGHQQGDNLIRRVAVKLRERVRATDIVARLSGDEFAVLMPQSDVEGAVQLGEDLRIEVADAFAGDPELAGASISVGITMFGVESDGGAEAVLAAADEAMYRAKAEGRNRVSLFEAPVDARLSDAARRLTTSAKIRNAITQNRFSLATQPIASLADGAIERFELLLRMRGESGEILPASAFIGVAERSGMIQELDRWVVGQALDLLGERQRAGDPVSLHVNLSGASLTDISVLEYIERKLDEGDADPARCTFEITQTARVEDLDTAAGFADRLTEFGCEVAIDDYGAGFGPFEYLKRFPFDVIKIDGAFVRDMAHNDADQLTVKAIVGIAQGLGKTTIAEFVEDEETVTMLRAYGVDMAQGYHLGAPVGLEDGPLEST